MKFLIFVQKETKKLKNLSPRKLKLIQPWRPKYAYRMGLKRGGNGGKDLEIHSELPQQQLWEQ